MLAWLCFLCACAGEAAPGPNPTDGGTRPMPNPEDEGKLLASPAGSVSGDPVEKSIGPEGGTLVSGEGRFELVVPAGALASATVVVVQEITSTAPGAVGTAVRLTMPGGVTLERPATLRFSLLERDVAGVDPTSFGVGSQRADGLWEKRPATFDPATRTVAAEAAHFSDWAALSGSQIIPGNASVQTGRSLGLQVSWCEEVSADQRPACTPGGTEPCLVAQCRRTTLGASLFSPWSVNSIAGGNTQIGTVSSNGSAATFTAPATAPNPPLVAVSVQLDALGSSEAKTLVSNITVTDQDEYSGDVYFFGLQGGTYAGDGRITFREIENLPDVARYEVVAGRFFVSATFPDCDPVKNIPIDAATGESEGALVVYKANSGSGQVHFWNAASLTRDVPMSCGDPRTTVMMPISVSLFADERPYDDARELVGKQRGLPLGGGVAWFFDRVAR